MRQGAYIRDDLTVAGPDHADGLRGSDAGGAGVSGGTKPLVMRCARGARSNAGIRRSIDRFR